MKRIIVGILAALTLTLGTAIGAGTATAGCTMSIPGGVAPCPPALNGGIDHNARNGHIQERETLKSTLGPIELPDLPAPKEKEEPTEEPTDPETETPEGGSGE